MTKKSPHAGFDAPYLDDEEREDIGAMHKAIDEGNFFAPTENETQQYCNESLLLGGLLRYNKKYHEIKATSQDFANEKHILVFNVITMFIGNDKPANVVTVSDYLELKTGNIYQDNWLVFLGELAQAVTSDASVVHYSEKVAQASRKRAVYAIAHELMENSGNEEQDAIGTATRKLHNLTNTGQEYDQTLGEILVKTVEYIEEVAKNKGKMVGIPSGLKQLDKALGGFHNSDLITIAGRPAMGKTAALLNFILAHDEPVGFISAEQGGVQIGLRTIGMQGGECVSDIRNGTLEEKQLAHVGEVASELMGRKGENVFVFDKPNPNIIEVIQQAHRWAHQHKIKALYVDYLQKIQGPQLSIGHERIGAVASELKTLARNLNIPVICLAQLNRATESDKKIDKNTGHVTARPTMANIGGSGAIEQESDIVITIYREDYYNKDAPPTDVTEFEIHKNRHGPTKRIDAHFDGKTMMFTDAP